AAAWARRQRRRRQGRGRARARGAARRRPARAPPGGAGERPRRAADVGRPHRRARRRLGRGARPVTTGRRQARRTALFLLYQWDLTGQPLTALYEREPDAFALDLADAVSAHCEELDRRITESAEGWTADRLGTLERNILRIGIHELEEESVPPEVAMNEAVVLARRYAWENAGRLVNGILARVAREKGQEVA